MAFWETFWATMWGAVAGAVIGALAAWIFALDLARRNRETAQADDAARREAQDASTYRTFINAMVGRVVETFHTLVAEIDGAGRVPFVPGMSGTASPTAVGRAKAEALAAVDTGRVHALGRDRDVFEVLRYAIERLSDGDEGALQASNIVLRLLEWDRIAPESSDLLIMQVVEIVPSVAADGVLPE